MIKSICEPAKCSGCFACVNVCPVCAIQMHIGKIGHIYPLITDKCIECGKCQKICPANNPVDLHQPKRTYAFWVKDDNEHRTSTSGGAAACFTNYILKNAGVVYGCAFLRPGDISHIKIEKIEDAYKLKGSKYVHSHINDSYKLIKSDLKNGSTVLFIGLPCQVAGLKNYIAEDSPRLYTIDLICHGVPSQHLLFQYIESIGIKREDINTISFRNQDGFNFEIQTDSGKLYKKNETKDLYYMAFNDNLCFRDSCYDCKYATSMRCGDLTIGDFWGLGQKIPFNYNTNGNISVVLVNTHRGYQLMELAGDSYIAVERTLDEAMAGNHNLNKPSVSSNRVKFHALYKKCDIQKALRKCLLKRRLKAPLLPIVNLLIKKLK